MKSKITKILSVRGSQQPYRAVAGADRQLTVLQSPAEVCTRGKGTATSKSGPCDAPAAPAPSDRFSAKTLLWVKAKQQIEPGRAFQRSVDAAEPGTATVVVFKIHAACLLAVLVGTQVRLLMLRAYAQTCLCMHSVAELDGHRPHLCGDAVTPGGERIGALFNELCLASERDKLSVHLAAFSDARYLDLGGKRLTTEHIEQVIGSLRLMLSLEILDLRDNQLDAGVFAPLIELAQQEERRGRIKGFLLEGNPIDAECTLPPCGSDLLYLTTPPKIDWYRMAADATHLVGDLSGVSWVGESPARLAGLPADLVALVRQEVWQFQGQPLGGAQFNRLLLAINQYGRNVRSLNLANTGLGDAELLQLCCHLAQLPALRYLDLRGHSFRLDSLHQLRDALGAAPRLLQLRLDPQPGVQPIADALRLRDPPQPKAGGPLWAEELDRFDTRESLHGALLTRLLGEPPGGDQAALPPGAKLSWD
ncbi:MAG: hypothetical protein EOO40_04990 [Deltaproteobacteria bacterium]|nr:MAG: hypothetical protein EOO40_04990 [Deltaproteobacteria bacterium]